MWKWTSKILLVVISFIAFAFIAYCVKQNSPNRDDAKLKELEQISSTVSKFPAFGSGATDTSSAADDAGIYNHYHSSANYDEVKNFYVNQLSQKGWTLIEEDSKGLKFRKDKYLIAIKYTGNNPKSGDWNYAVSFVWRDYY